MPMSKPELLLPAGNVEALHAALEGGADAVYLGARRFSARARARNFPIEQLGTVAALVHERGARLYLAFNTLVKNDELPAALDLLHVAQQAAVDGVIIQDYGLYLLARRHFPQLSLHASTQMGVHNSVGANHAATLGLKRVILARELTLPELRTLAQRTNIELEMFVHGALCYSLSGSCLFSSYLGGMSANRGSCRQPCRRLYFMVPERSRRSCPERSRRDGIKTGMEDDSSTRPSLESLPGGVEPPEYTGQSAYLFSLNDLQLLELLPRLRELGIASFKVEGRMRSADYVYAVARAYRQALDNPGEQAEALRLLGEDTGRKKTVYFAGGDVDRAFTAQPYTGIPLGTIEALDEGRLRFRTKHALTVRDRVRVVPASGEDSAPFRIKQLWVEGKPVQTAAPGNMVEVPQPDLECRRGDPLLLAASARHRFPNRLAGDRGKRTRPLTPGKQRTMLADLKSGTPGKQTLTAVRIDCLAWLPKVFLQRLDYLILDLTRKEWQALDLKRPFLQKNLPKLVAQLPLFIAEGQLDFYRDLLQRLYKQGMRNFMLSRLSQKLLLPPGRDVRFWCAESVYVVNDAAARLLQEQGTAFHTYSFESDFPNLFQGQDRAGFIPMYFFPRLFVSRMPSAHSVDYIKDRDRSYRVLRRDGLTLVVPERPVAILQHRKRLQDKGFRHWLLDFSFLKPSSNAFNRILKELETSTLEAETGTFNFRSGLK